MRGEEMDKKQQIMATVAATGEAKRTQQPTKSMETGVIERMQLAGGGGWH